MEQKLGTCLIRLILLILVEEALSLDAEDPEQRGLWRTAIQKEMKKIS